MTPADYITAVTVNFRTPDLVYIALNTFRAKYPGVSHVVVDNGGCGESLKKLRKLRDKGLLTLIENASNMGHGLALNIGLELVLTDYAFLLDSDTRTDNGGYIEQMYSLFKGDPELFAVGWLRMVNNSGVAYRGKAPKTAHEYIHPYACMLDMIKFRQLPEQFNSRGAPALPVMIEAKARGWRVKSFPIEDYIWHKIGGTRGLFGGQIRPTTHDEVRPFKRVAI